MKKSYLMMAVMLFAALTFTACKKGGSKNDAAKADSLKKDSIEKANANKPEKMIVKSWALMESPTLKDDKKYKEILEQSYANFKEDMMFEMTSPRDPKNVRKGKYMLLEDGRKVLLSYKNDKGKDQNDTAMVNLTADRLELTVPNAEDAKKPFNLVYKPKN